MIFTPPPSQPLSLSLFCLCEIPDFDVVLLVKPYFSWLLNSNGKNNVTKFSLLPECINLTFFLCAFKRWSNYLEVTLAL